MQRKVNHCHRVDVARSKVSQFHHAAFQYFKFNVFIQGLSHVFLSLSFIPLTTTHGKPSPQPILNRSKPNNPGCHWNQIVRPNLNQLVNLVKQFFIDASSRAGCENLFEQIMVNNLYLNKHDGQLAHEFIVIDTVDNIDKKIDYSFWIGSLKSATLRINMAITLATTLTLALTGYSGHRPTQYLPSLLWRKECYPGPLREPFPSPTISQCLMKFLCLQ